MDPDVEALLNDLPPPDIPEACLKEGWGHHSMRYSLAYGGGKLRSPTQGNPQPIFDSVCCQCGRPIADNGKDHNGVATCDQQLLFGDEEWSHHFHITASVRADIIADRKVVEKWRGRSLLAQGSPHQRARRQASKLGPCTANRAARTCHHVCFHEPDHFGFHECKFCHALWR